MRLIYITSLVVISAIFFLSSTCGSSNPDNQSKQKYTSLDSVWLPFAEAMESKNIEFLIKNSLDSITCYDCNIDSANEQEYFDSEFILKNYLDKIMHLPTLSDKVFSTYQININLIKVVYKIKAQQAPEGEYGLIFTLVKKENKYLFQGMMVQ